MSTELFTTTEAEPTTTAERGALVLLGRTLFAAIFVLAGAKNFSPHAIQEAAALGVPMSSLAVPLSGALALAGGLSVLLGYRARLGAWLLVLFLAPVTLAMHPFWATADPQLAQLHTIMFLKNLSMIGGALLLTQRGAGPSSLDARRARRARLIERVGEGPTPSPVEASAGVMTATNHPRISPPAGDATPSRCPYALLTRTFSRGQ